MTAKLHDVLIVDNHSLYRGALTGLLESSVPEIGSIQIAERAAEVISIAASKSRIALIIVNPDALALDRQSAVEVIGRLFGPSSLIVLIEHTAPGDDGIALPAGAAGALGRTKNADDIAALVSGFLSGSARPAKGMDTLTGMPASNDEAMAQTGELACYHKMTRRQREVMGMVSEGLANKEIAARLGIAEGTVKAHVHTLFKTFGATNRTQVAIAFSGAAAPSVGLLPELSHQRRSEATRAI